MRAPTRSGPGPWGTREGAQPWVPGRGEGAVTCGHSVPEPQILPGFLPGHTSGLRLPGAQASLGTRWDYEEEVTSPAFSCSAHRGLQKPPHGSMNEIHFMGPSGFILTLVKHFFFFFARNKRSETGSHCPENQKPKQTYPFIERGPRAYVSALLKPGTPHSCPCTPECFASFPTAAPSFQNFFYVYF